MGRKRKPLTYEALLDKLNYLIEKSHAALESKQWAGVRPTDLIAFMVLAKDIVKETRNMQKNNGDPSELDEWLDKMN